MKTDLLEKLKDPRYFIERFFWIIDKRRHKVPFLFNPPQSDYYRDRSQNDLILKARKEGFSSLVEAIWLHSCMFNENENCVTMAHTWDDTVIHMDRVKFFLDNMGLPDMKFKVPLDKENQREIFFPKTNSRYWIGTAGSVAFGRGRDITKLHLSEVAHYPDQRVVTGVMEACVPHASKVLETTANGVGELFHKLWQEAGDPSSDTPWRRHFFPWFQDPSNRVPMDSDAKLIMKSNEQKLATRFKLDDEQMLWYRKKLSEMPEKDKMPQEHPSTAEEAFLRSGRPVFNLEKLHEKKEFVKGMKPLFHGDLIDDGEQIKAAASDTGFLKIWKMPRRGRQYLVVGDVSEGVPGGDWSFGQIFDRASWEQVAVWRGRINPGDFGREMVRLGYYFNNAIIVPEGNNHGWATVEAIVAEKYKHLFKTTDIWPDDPERLGFHTNDKTRNLIITAARNSIEDDTVFFNDFITLTEFETFIQNENSGKMEAQQGCYDDGVMSAAIGIFLLKFLTVDETYGDHVQKNVVSSLGQLRLKPTGDSRRKSGTGYR